MNILVISDNFSKGGLETHIDTYYEYLKKDNNIIFAFGNYEKGNYLNGAKILWGDFHFSASSTIIDFQEDVELLVKIIKDNNIDIIHVHPFYCLFPAIVAANITSTKIVFTVHGRVSLNFFNNTNDTILYKFAVEEILNAIFCVSTLGQQWLSKYNADKIFFMPNLVDCNQFYEHEVVANKRWALVSRLDTDKSKEIMLFLDMLNDLDIEAIDIYGSGESEEQLKEYVKKNGLSNKVFFKGYCDRIENALDKKYNGVIGQGRVVLEALAMNYPVINIGLCKIGGLIDERVYSLISTINFVPTILKSVSAKQLNEQLKNLKNLKKYQFRKKIQEDFSSKRIKEYCDIVSSASFYENSVLLSWYNATQKINDKKALFYNSSEVFNLLVQYIIPYSGDVELKAFVNANTRINDLNQRLYDTCCNLASATDENKMLNQEVSDLKKEVDLLKKQCELLEKRVIVTENTGLTTLVKRAYKNAVKKNK